MTTLSFFSTRKMPEKDEPKIYEIYDDVEEVVEEPTIVDAKGFMIYLLQKYCKFNTL